MSPRWRNKLRPFSSRPTNQPPLLAQRILCGGCRIRGKRSVGWAGWKHHLMTHAYYSHLEDIPKKSTSKRLLQEVGNIIFSHPGNVIRPGPLGFVSASWSGWQKLASLGRASSLSEGKKKPSKFFLSWRQQPSTFLRRATLSPPRHCLFCQTLLDGRSIVPDL